VPIFQAFMEKAVQRFGGTKFKVPPGGHFINIDRFTGARLPDGAKGANVQAEYFRDGEEPDFGVSAAVVDGGFRMGENLPLFAVGEKDGGGTQAVTTADGKVKAVPKKAKFGSLSSGGLY
jgi:penicillin-binding protein 1A